MECILSLCTVYCVCYCVLCVLLCTVCICCFMDHPSVFVPYVCCRWVTLRPLYACSSQWFSPPSLPPSSLLLFYLPFSRVHPCACSGIHAHSGEITYRDYANSYYRDFLYYSRTKNPEALIWARPVDLFWSFAPHDTMFSGWVGDQDPTFDGLRNALINMLQSAHRNYLNFGSDTGGYRSGGPAPYGRSTELFTRWFQMSAFCPHFEVGLPLVVFVVGGAAVGNAEHGACVCDFFERRLWWWWWWCVCVFSRVFFVLCSGCRCVCVCILSDIRCALFRVSFCVRSWLGVGECALRVCSEWHSLSDTIRSARQRTC
jgi:Glycosyl hydrolases family 31 TIM-barrel domain